MTTIAVLILAALVLAEAVVIAAEDAARRLHRDREIHLARYIHDRIDVDTVPGPDGQPLIIGWLARGAR